MAGTNRPSEDENLEALRALEARVVADWDELEAHKVWLVTVGLAGDGGEAPPTAVEVWLAAPSEEYARRVLHERYGERVSIGEWLGPERTTEVAVPWASYGIVGDAELVLRYASDDDREDARVVVDEAPTHVIVTIYEQEPVRGTRLLRVQRTIRARLNEPLAGRTVIDGAAREDQS
jgi:hypothetical protein